MIDTPPQFPRLLNRLSFLRLVRRHSSISSSPISPLSQSLHPSPIRKSGNPHEEEDTCRSILFSISSLFSKEAMTGSSLLRSPPVTRVPTPNIQCDTSAHASPAASHRVGCTGRCGEVAGRSAAEVTAVACCCPFAVMDLVLLALYKVPAGLCRKAGRRKRRRLAKKRRQQRSMGPVESVTDVDVAESSVADLIKKGGTGDEAAGKLEKEMWAQFSEAGFWRSPSASRVGVVV